MSQVAVFETVKAMREAVAVESARLLKRYFRVDD